MAKIYVSYTKRDTPIATRIVEGLRKRGHTVSWDADVLRPGQDWRAALAQALRDSHVVIAVLTEHAFTAPYMMSEVGAARVLGKVVVPLVFDDIEFPNVVQDLFCLRATESALEQTLDQVNRDMAKFAGDNKKVFIVHGQNEAKKLELKDFLSKLALDPMILHQENDLGKTIIEKFEHYASQCAFAIVLLTPEDKQTPADDSKEQKWRARQNVILELGWFMAKLGRDRVLLLHKGDLEIPSDISGVIYAPFRESVTEAGETIRDRLKGVGLLS